MGRVGTVDSLYEKLSAKLSLGFSKLYFHFRFCNSGYNCLTALYSLMWEYKQQLVFQVRIIAKIMRISR